jgi:transcriptional regulator with XRE-family HTH domain
MTQQPGQRQTLAGKINFLFATVRPPDEDREYTNCEVAAATDLSGSYLGYLRRGVRDNPSVEAVQALARFFGVRPSYLVDNEPDEERAAQTEAQLRLAQALKNPGIVRLATRAAEAHLSPAALDAITAMIDQVSKLEQQAASRKRGARET